MTPENIRGPPSSNINNTQVAQPQPFKDWEAVVTDVGAQNQFLMIDSLFLKQPNLMRTCF